MTAFLALGSFVIIVGAMMLVALWRDPDFRWGNGPKKRKRAKRRYEDFTGQRGRED